MVHRVARLPAALRLYSEAELKFMRGEVELYQARSQGVVGNTLEHGVTAKCMRGVFNQ
jgi:hypothetical protein